MRRTLLAGVSVIALTGAATAADITYYPPPSGPVYHAAPMVQAHVDLYGGKAWFNYDGDTESAGVFGGAGRANVPFQNGWNFQMDAQGQALLFHEGKGGATYSTPTEFSGYGHIYRSVPDSHAVGLYGGAAWAYGPQAYTIGAEGQMYWQQFTLYGQASVSAVRFGSETGHAFQLRGQGQWFATDNTAILGDVSWTSLNLYDETASALSLQGTVMHRFENTPFAAFGKVRWTQANWDDYSPSVTTALVGVRIIADQPGSTLKQSLRGVPMNVDNGDLFFIGKGGPR